MWTQEEADRIKAAMREGLREGRALRAARQAGAISEGVAVAAVCARPDSKERSKSFKVIPGGKSDAPGK